MLVGNCLSDSYWFTNTEETLTLCDHENSKEHLWNMWRRHKGSNLSDGSINSYQEIFI